MISSEYYFDAAGEPQRTKFRTDVESAAAAYHLDQPYFVHVDEDGNEEWFYLVHMAGRDDHGVYQRVLEGPAEGEKAYL